MSIELTERAAARIRKQIAQRGQGLGLRLGVRKSGCSGYAYKMDFADEVAADDTVVEAHGVKLVIARQDLRMLDGIRVDFRREGLGEVFKFDNPNVEALCGCGESFAVKAGA